ncbi:MAG: UDP-N-acetylmuramoyl-L-alanyl-D-glutamate--2,6-diaminopimelate ligase [Parvibaculaceae bacterium]
MTLARLAGKDAPPEWAGIEITGLTDDSRKVAPGYLFAAVPGTATDGARFIPEAVARGAAAVLAPDAARFEAPAASAVIREANVRRRLAQMAAKFFSSQPEIVVAVTGTSGKTSVASFVRQIWEASGHAAASIGTLGVVGPDAAKYLAHTTPDPVTLHEALARLAEDGVTHLALEASSHGLAQFRLDAVRFTAGAFTNLSRDHLDYHATADDYFQAKMRLFDELLPPGGSAVVNADAPEAEEVEARARRRGLRVLTVGQRGRDLKLIACRREGFGQELSIEFSGRLHQVLLPLVGGFQASNALVAAGLVLAAGGAETTTMRALERLVGASGRLELVARTAEGAPVFVDYSHKPDALSKTLEALRPYASGRLAVVFGCGGDRDRGKRPQMGEIATNIADRVYVTDDNPRSEEPATIRAEILKGAPGAIEIGDRREAIRRAVEDLEAGDVLVVAGKGHETGQIVGSEILPFSDQETVREAVGESTR